MRIGQFSAHEIQWSRINVITSWTKKCLEQLPSKSNFSGLWITCLKLTARFFIQNDLHFMSFLTIIFQLKEIEMMSYNQLCVDLTLALWPGFVPIRRLQEIRRSSNFQQRIRWYSIPRYIYNQLTRCSKAGGSSTGFSWVCTSTVEACIVFVWHWKYWSILMSSSDMAF